MVLACFVFLLIDYVFHAVYPPRSMDNPEFRWQLDEAFLHSFMSTYPPMPDHLRRRRGSNRRSVTAGGVSAMGEAAQSVDVTVETEDAMSGDVAALESDPDDNIPLSKRKVGGVDGPSSLSPRRVRRRLVIKSALENSGTNLEVDALNIPVSI